AAGGKTGGDDKSHSCALSTTGTVLCWGYNSSGQLGNGTTGEQPSPVAVTGLPAVVEVALGANHSCARTAAGAVWCWGQNGSGQLGNGGSVSTSTPVAS